MKGPRLPGIFGSRRAALAGVLLSIAGVMTPGCGAPSIDASSPESMQASIEHVRSQLGAQDRAEFDRAMADLNDMLFNRTDALSQATISQYRPETLLRKILHGKTAGDVIRTVAEHRARGR